MAASLQAINDKIKEIETNIGLLQVITSTAGTSMSATLPTDGVYLAVAGGQSSNQTSAVYLITNSWNGIVTKTITPPANNSHTITVSGKTWSLSSAYGIFGAIYRLR